MRQVRADLCSEPRNEEAVELHELFEHAFLLGEEICPESNSFEVVFVEFVQRDLIVVDSATHGNITDTLQGIEFREELVCFQTVEGVADHTIEPIISIEALHVLRVVLEREERRVHEDSINALVAFAAIYIYVPHFVKILIDKVFVKIRLQ